MPIVKRPGRCPLPAWLGLAASLVLLAGCTLCDKHLYLYRETPEKKPPSEVALLIADPEMVKAAMPGAQVDLEGGRWASEQSSYQTESYRLSIDEVDGRKVYQGRCLDTPLNDAVEVRAGTRQVGVRVDLLGPGGQEKFFEAIALDLKGGRAYFFRPDWQALQDRRLAIKVEPLPEPYTAGERARLIDWRKKTSKTASLD